MFKTLFPVGFVVSVAASTAVVPQAVAQITPALDGTGTAIRQEGQQFNIDGGSLSGDGQNLFHSFEQFGLSSGQVADFFVQPTVQNVLGRVVGGDASIINGMLQVSGGAANLYLMNPAGVVFGNDAQLNVPGDFTATTATGIGFESGQWFNAVGASSYGQLTGSPTGFHLGAGSIVNSGDLAVGLGRQLSLVSNSAVNVGSLSAPEGHILITALPGEDVLRLKFPGYSLGLELDLIDEPVSEPTAWTLPVAALSDLLRLDSVRSSEAIAGIPDAPGTALVGGSVDVSGEQGGRVGIFGDRVGLFGAQVDATGTTGGGQVLVGGEYRGQGTTPTASRTVVDRESVIGASVIADGDGGEVIVWADEATQFSGSINARGGLTLGDGGFVEVSGKVSLSYLGEVDVGSAIGSAGTLLLDPENIFIFDGAGQANDADLANSEIMFGDAPVAGTSNISEDVLRRTTGDIVLEATRNIEIADLADDKLAFLPGGSIQFEAGNEFIMRGSATDRIDTAGRDIEIMAGSIVAGDIIASSITGPAGSITLQTLPSAGATGDIAVGGLNATTYSADPDVSGDGGVITVDSIGSLTIDGSRPLGLMNDPDLSVGVSALSANGDAGKIILSANGNISIICPSDFCLSNTGNGGPLDIPKGSGGDITLTSTTGSIEFNFPSGTDSSPLSTNSGLTFDAGDIVLSALQGDITVPGRIEASVQGGAGGNISLEAGGVLQVADVVANGDTGSGDITISSSNSDVSIGNISASSFGSTGGNISLESGGSLSVGTIFVTSSSEVGGEITLSSVGNLEAGQIDNYGTLGGNDISITSSNGGISLSNLNPGSFDGIGGDVTLSGSGDINIDDIDARGGIAAGDVTITSTAGSLSVGTVQAGSTGQDGSDISLSSFGDIQGDTIDTNSNLMSGAVSINSENGSISLNTVQTVSTAADGGEVSLISDNGNIQVNNIDSGGGLTGGQIDVIAANEVGIDAVDTQGTNAGGRVAVNSQNSDINIRTIQTNSDNVGGVVELTSLGNVQVDSIDSQGIAVSSGQITISSGNNVVVDNIQSGGQAGGSVDIDTSRNVQLSSIDTSGIASGGDVEIDSTGGEIAIDTVATSSAQIGGQLMATAVGDISINTIDTQGIGTSGGGVTVSSGDSVAVNSLQTGSDQIGGDINIVSTGDTQLSNIDTQGGAVAGRLGVASSGDRIIIDTIQSASDQTGGTVDISSPSSIQIGDIDVRGTALSGGIVRLASTTESVTVGDVQATSDSQGGTVEISAPSSVQIGDIDVQGTTVAGGSVQLTSEADGVTVGDIQAASNNQGGAVTLASLDTIQTGFIDAQGGPVGGVVDITTENLFRATSFFTDNNGVDASISAAGATDGQVIIRHDGGNQTIPFIVGDAGVNGTAGAITTGANNTIPATRGFIGSYTQGDIQIVTADFFDPETGEFPPPQELTELQETPFWLDEYFTRQYEAYMGEGEETPVKSLDEIQQILGEMGDATGVKPALVYVIFEPGNLVTEVENASDFANRGDLMRLEPTPEDEIYLVMVTPEGVPTARRVDASSATRGDASASISRFRQSLFEAREYPGDGRVPEATQQQAQDMYQWFLEPLRAEIEAQGVNNLVYIMEAGLRSAPLATLSAMHDGNDYTIRDYSIGLMPSFSLTDTRYQDIRHAELRAMGASEFERASSLPAAEVELAAVSDIWSKRETSFVGRSHPPMQNEDFTWENVSQQNSDQLGILHLATHASFDPAVPQDSFIRLAGDEQIPFGSIREMSLPIELLVLSACQTALEGNSYEAELGFGGLAVQTGVKSALASLWSVDDAGTFALMSTFYGYLNGNGSENPMIKAEALRQAQIAMLDNRVRVEDGYLYYSETQNPLALPESFQRYLERGGNPNLNVSHPYYWAGFTMIGSPW